ncbi:MAG: hypothetical protein NUV69_03525 [Candidatus Curtissbacteria bacterium]|nr:hypothetical protein [Candidatus Curtissbacteria bacterium]
MPRFHKTDVNVDHHSGRVISKEELDAKRQAAVESRTIVSWKSPVHIFKQRSKKYFTKVALYAFVFILAAIAFGEFFLVGVIIALVFVVYVFANSAPEVIEHKITNLGIISGGRVFLWEELDSFWFDKKGDERLLLVQTHMHFPSRLILILTTISERTLLEQLERHLHYHAAPVHTLLDKWAHKLQSKISLD